MNKAQIEADKAELDNLLTKIGSLASLGAMAASHEWCYDHSPPDFLLAGTRCPWGMEDLQSNIFFQILTLAGEAFHISQDIGLVRPDDDGQGEPQADD